MTKQELVEMMGSEENAVYAMLKVLECVKKEFVRSCLKASADNLETQIKLKESSGYYSEFNTFPKDFNLWEAMSTGDPLADQYEKNEMREIEQAGDRQTLTFARNMWVRSMNH